MNNLMDSIKSSLAPNALNLIILPTEKCCFRCEYCYEDFSIGKMPNDIQQGIINLIRKRQKTLDTLSVSWFGGEPLMAKDIIYSMSESIQSLATENNIKYSCSMTTNAYLLDIFCYERLVNLGVNFFQITLDGPKDIHDNVRKLVDGGGTFDKIMNNLYAIKNSSAKAEILLRIHYKPDTWLQVLDLVDDLKRNLLDDPRFKVKFESVGKWGGENDANFEVFEQDDAELVRKKLLARLEHTPSTDRFDESEQYICYASKANNMIIRADGRIAKCTVALSSPHNDVGRIDPDGTLTIYQERYKQWLIGLQTGNEQQLSCPAGTVLRQPVSALQGIPVMVAA